MLFVLLKLAQSRTLNKFILEWSLLLKDFQKIRQKFEEIIEREKIWNIPNVLYIRRILSTPCLEYLIVSQNYQVSSKFSL